MIGEVCFFYVLIKSPASIKLMTIEEYVYLGVVSTWKNTAELKGYPFDERSSVGKK